MPSSSVRRSASTTSAGEVTGIGTTDEGRGELVFGLRAVPLRTVLRAALHRLVEIGDRIVDEPEVRGPRPR